MPYQLADQAAQEGIVARIEMHSEGPRQGSELCLVASYADSRRAVGKGHPVCWVAHGAGQSYDGDPASARMSGYPGGRGHEGTQLFLEAGERAAAKWRQHYPEVRSMAIGCPRLDGFHRMPSRARARQPKGATVAISFHWPCPLVAETRSAWAEYVEHLPRIVAELTAMGCRVLGHSHPRLWQWAGPAWERVGAEPVADLDEVLRSADVFAADNTSALPEAASVGISLVWITPGFYRRDVVHGGRFWDWPAGQVECTDPLRLPEAIEAALADPPEVATARAAMVADVYAATDGRAAERAAAAILAAVG